MTMIYSLGISNQLSQLRGKGCGKSDVSQCCTIVEPHWNLNRSPWPLGGTALPHGLNLKNLDVSWCFLKKPIIIFHVSFVSIYVFSILFFSGLGLRAAAGSSARPRRWRAPSGSAAPRRPRWTTGAPRPRRRAARRNSAGRPAPPSPEGHGKFDHKFYHKFSYLYFKTYPFYESWNLSFS